MLTPGQEKYLNSFLDDRVCQIFPFDPKCLETGNEIVDTIKQNVNNIDVYYIGSSVLQIAGENDIDISVVSKNNFDEDYLKMKSVFGEPKEYKPEKEYVKWEFTKNGFVVELYLNGKLTQILQEQIDTHNILMNNESLREDYEKIKNKFNGKLWKEYMKAKMEFFNEVLKPKVYLLCGLTGSGKSTWAEKFVEENPNTVWYKFDKEFFLKYGKDYDWKRHDEYEEIVKAEILEKIKLDILNKKDVILDFGFWKKVEREETKNLILSLGAIPKLLYFKQPKEILLKRLEERNKLNLPHEHIIPASWLDEFEKKFEEPDISEEFEII